VTVGCPVKGAVRSAQGQQIVKTHGSDDIPPSPNRQVHQAFKTSSSLESLLHAASRAAVHAAGIRFPAHAPPRHRHRVTVADIGCCRQAWELADLLLGKSLEQLEFQFAAALTAQPLRVGALSTNLTSPETHLQLSTKLSCNSLPNSPPNSPSNSLWIHPQTYY
jgi:hypothetical protein